MYVSLAAAQLTTQRYDPRTDIPELARGIQDQFLRARPLMLESFRVA